MSAILIIIFLCLSWWIANKSTDDYISRFNKENKFYRPLMFLGKTAIALLFFIIIISLFHIIFNFNYEPEINILTFSAIGIIVSVLLTVTHNFYIKEEDKIKSKIDNDKEINNLLISLKDEINLVWMHFKDDVDEHICSKQVTQIGFQMFIEITMDYFVIYNNNTDKIGRIKNKELREKIIFIQIKAKSLIDSLLFNNKMLNDTIKYKDDKALIEAYNKVLIQYATVLQNKYYEMDNAIKEVNALFDSDLI